MSKDISALVAQLDVATGKDFDSIVARLNEIDATCEVCGEGAASVCEWGNRHFQIIIVPKATAPGKAFAGHSNMHQVVTKQAPRQRLPYFWREREWPGFDGGLPEGAVVATANSGVFDTRESVERLFQ